MMTDSHYHESDLEFEPPITLSGTQVTAEINCESGRARVTIRDLMTGRILEIREDCQMLDIEGKKRVIVSAPGGIVRRAKLGWKFRLLRWLAT